MEKLTVLILNWQRPGNVVKLIRTYLAMPAVAGVIVSDCSGSLPEPESNPGLIVNRFSRDPGLVARFTAAGLARTKTVALVDDDIVVSEKTLLDLQAARSAHQSGVSGIFGRKTDAAGNYDTSRYVYGAVPIVLTRAAVTSVELCLQSIGYVHDMVAELGGEPYGNGEDIVLSYTALRYGGGRFNRATSSPFKNMGYDDAAAISVRNPDHARHRSCVVQWCRKHVYNESC